MGAFRKLLAKDCTLGSFCHLYLISTPESLLIDIIEVKNEFSLVQRLVLKIVGWLEGGRPRPNAVSCG